MKKPEDVRPGDNVEVIPAVDKYILARTDITHRLAAPRCESCGKEQGYFEVHHVRKMKDVQGKESWKKVMLGRRRTTRILWIECPDQLHKGILPDWTRNARRTESLVRYKPHAGFGGG